MDIKDLPFRVDAPYPEVKIEAPNKAIANILQNLYASCGSETTAVLQYVYQHYIIKPKEPDIALVLEKIGQTEMHHHDLLGNLIASLGGNPFYNNSQGVPFRVSCVYNGTNLKQILSKNIEDEKQAIEDYNKAIRRIENPQITALLSRIVQDEEVHIATFEAIQDYINFYK